MIIDPDKFKKKQRTQAELEKMLKPYKGLAKTVVWMHWCFGKKDCPYCKANRGQ